VEALLLHLHPRSVPADALRFSRTLGAGGAALVLVVLATGTGSLLLAACDPSPERAHGAVLRLAREVPFGAFVRSAHRWAADGALAVAAVHLLRVVFRGAFLPPRHVNWLVGLALLAAVAGAAYTGRLLPWDQLGFWSIHISTAMLEAVPVAGGPLLRLVRGGAEVGPRTLALFHGLHVGVLPLTLAALLALHFWQVRRCGGVLPGAPAASPGAARGPLVPVNHLVLRECVAALITIAAVLLLAAAVDAPLQAEANTRMSPDPATAPWFLAGVQELLVHVHPTFGVVVWPALAIGSLIALPALAGPGAASGAWFQTARGARRTAVAALAAAGLATLAVIALEPLRQRPALLAPLPAWIGSGILPLLGTATFFAGVVRRTRRDGGSRLEAVQLAVAVAVAGLLVLTVTGVAARGPGMALGAPSDAVRPGGAP
jgi:quinol-cytochrome oxidoreductase complex cytochrome b subunit